MKSIYNVLLLLTLCNIVNKVGHCALEESIFDKPLIGPEMVSYYTDKRPLRIDVSVSDASGRGERALDFFVIEGSQSIPITLRQILAHSAFMNSMIHTMSHKANVLMVTESISLGDGKEKVNGFIGISKSDLAKILRSAPL